MKKVKLTKEQAYVIESKTLYELGEWFYTSLDKDEYMFELFQDFCIEKIARAKLIGYEVETEEEEKNRRWWAAHGRDVWELKKGDVLQEPYNDIEEVESIHPNGNYIVLGTWDETRETSVEIQKESGSRIICFVEDRKDIKDDSNA